jgi:SAM-dependent methyltransferase
MSVVGQRSDPDDWDAHWDRYDELLGLNPGPLMRWQLIIKLLRRHAPVTERLLDVGSGQGNFLVRARAAGVAQSYAGFEMSESGVEKSRRRLPGAEFLQVDLFAPPRDAERFRGWATAAVCSEVIEHVDDAVAFLEQLKTYLAANALLILTVPGGPMSQFDHHIGHRFHYTAKRAARTLERAGYEVERVMLAGFPFFNLFRFAIILRGSRIAEDAELSETGSGRLTRFAMAVFRALFKANLDHSPFGWQVVAIARKRDV